MIARKPGQFVASGGVRINFKSHLKFYPTSGPGRNRVEIETRSDDQRTGIARRSPDIGLIDRAYTAAGDRLIAGGPPHDVRRTPDDARYDTRTMNPISGARRAITRKKKSAADRTVLNCVTHRTAMPQAQIIRSPADVSHLQASGRLDTSEPSAVR
ncbi:hypothetical protein DPMN_133283 [Dreissena polymorpha]|uniref:Uncharacterized protein n=1 Tax=Dreissena polymorpha TaxID=45954 RepID=A0A9D4FVA7_DREPO|nr:hypothetical protein DPMN_133283 [Dreissena polymorpha]